MKIGERIKERRKELNLSVDDVAKKLNKNRATIYRYESNEIENLPINILEPLSKVLNTTPAYLMGWKKNQNADESSTNNNSSGKSDEEKTLLENFRKLNDLGKKEAAKRVAELTEISRYIKNTSEKITYADDVSSNNQKKYLTYDDFKTIAAHNDDLTDDEIAEADRKILENLNKRL